MTTSNKRPDEYEDFTEFCEFVSRELGDIPVLDQGTFISPKIRYYWAVWRKYSLSLVAQKNALIDAKGFYHLYQGVLGNSRSN